MTGNYPEDFVVTVDQVVPKTYEPSGSPAVAYFRPMHLLELN